MQKLLSFCLQKISLSDVYRSEIYIGLRLHAPPPPDDSQGALRFPLSVRLSVRPFVTLYVIEFVYQLLHFAMVLFETLHTCYEHNEDVHVGFFFSFLFFFFI